MVVDGLGRNEDLLKRRHRALRQHVDVAQREAVLQRRDGDALSVGRVHVGIRVIIAVTACRTVSAWAH